MSEFTSDRLLVAGFPDIAALCYQDKCEMLRLLTGELATNFADRGPCKMDADAARAVLVAGKILAAAAQAWLCI